LGGSVWVYLGIGAPGYGDLPLRQRVAEAEALKAARPSQETAEAQVPPAAVEVPEDYRALAEQLREAVAERPGDVEGLALLARTEANLGDFRAAHAAQGQLLALKGDTVTVADMVTYADLLTLAAGGYVSPEAEAMLRRILTRDPRNGVARYYAGLVEMQTGRPDRAFAIWRALLEESTPDARWARTVATQIDEAAARAGERYEVPPRFLAPSGSGMTAADIQNMVSGLAERLATEGGPAEDWARLIRSYGVLGETEAAAAIWAEAQQAFQGLPDAMAVLEEAAARAGLR
ncbi:MAG: c-type cytochrome biogenesis protein CcmI, partial [Pseudomonadota bacterium]